MLALSSWNGIVVLLLLMALGNKNPLVRKQHSDDGDARQDVPDRVNIRCTSMIAGLLALYLCTRNCCGVILNLFFSSAAVGCGVGLYLSGFSRSLGIMFIIVGLLMMVVIVLALIYHKLTGESGLRVPTPEHEWTCHAFVEFFFFWEKQYYT